MMPQLASAYPNQGRLSPAAYARLAARAAAAPDPTPQQIDALRRIFGGTITEAAA